MTMDLKSKIEVAETNWDVILETLERNGLHPKGSDLPKFSSVHYDYGESLDNIIGHYATAEYNGLEFAVGFRTISEKFGEYSPPDTNLLSIALRPKGSIKNFIPYTDDFPALDTLEVHYDIIDMTPPIIDSLIGIGGRIILPEEVYSGSILNGHRYSEWIGMHLSKPFITIMYFLQEPNEKHATCIAAVNPGTIDTKMLPHHKWQPEEGHYCRVDEDAGFPFLLLDPEFFQSRQMGLDLLLHSIYRMEKSRANELLNGLPLTINTTIELNSLGLRNLHNQLHLIIHGDPNIQYINPHNIKYDHSIMKWHVDEPHKPYDLSTGKFKFKYHGSSIGDLLEAFPEVFSHFLRVYGSFTK